MCPRIFGIFIFLDTIVGAKVDLQTQRANSRFKR